MTPGQNLTAKDKKLSTEETEEGKWPRRRRIHLILKKTSPHTTATPCNICLYTRALTRSSVLTTQTAEEPSGAAEITEPTELGPAVQLDKWPPPPPPPPRPVAPMYLPTVCMWCNSVLPQCPVSLAQNQTTDQSRVTGTAWTTQSDSEETETKTKMKDTLDKSKTHQGLNEHFKGPGQL